MYDNPLPNEKTESVMEGLQPRQSVPQTPQAVQAVHAAPVVHAAQATTAVETDGNEERAREDAFTLKFAIGKLKDYLQWFFMVIEAILAIRFLLRVFGANPENLFASFVLALTDILLAPFANIVPSISLHTNQAFEISTLIAMLVYFLFFYALKRFLHILTSNPEEQE